MYWLMDAVFPCALFQSTHWGFLITQYLPLGGTISQLFALSYGRDREHQADTLSTRLIVATGLRNLMVTLEKQQKNAPPS